MSAVITPHPSAPRVSQRTAAEAALGLAAVKAGLLAMETGQEADRLRAELLGHIADGKWSRAVLALATLSTFDNARSA